MKNFLIGALLVIVIVLAAALYFSVKSELSQVQIPYSFTPSPQNMGTSIVGSLPTAPGTVTGKLCFPSEMLPAGAIEAKGSDNFEVAQVYPGSANGGSSSYSLDLPPGTYKLRYKADISPTMSTYGYHTTTCPTGLETTCASTYPREHIQINVVSGHIVSGVDLCDFYYDPQSPPVF